MPANGWKIMVNMSAFSFPIDRVVVIERRAHADDIIITLDGPTTFPKLNYPLSITVQARRGFGAQWVRDNLAIEPIVVGDPENK